MKENNQLHFTKMHGLGNDFMMIDGVNQKISLTAKQIRNLANRHTGIGFDQCLIVESAKDDSMDFYYRIFNSDGNEVGQCGNGARCLAVFIKDRNLSDKDSYRVTTQTSRLTLKPLNAHSAWVEFEEPNFSPNKVPIAHEFQADYYPFECNGKIYYLHCVTVGNPHGILLVDELWDDEVSQIGRLLSQHPKFPEGANISFVKLLNKGQAKLRVYERGAGETLACGSAAIATAACLKIYHQCAEQIVINLPGGDLTIKWKGLGRKISFTGNAQTVFNGTISL